MIKNIKITADWGLVAFVGFFDENGPRLEWYVYKEYLSDPSDT
jgi:hypothetical protein